MGLARIVQFRSLRGFQWSSHELSVPALPPELAGLRIVHLTDTHIGRRWLGGYDELIARLADDPPDLILFTGDFVDNILDHRPALNTARRFFSRLRSRLGIFAITGNHDGDLLGPRIVEFGATLINRRYVRLTSATAALELIGLPGVRRRNFDPAFIASIPPAQPGVPRIVLGHFPDQARLIEPLRADAMLAGHTHGGQICLPGGRALITHDRLPKSFASGAHRIGATTLFVSRGFGMTRWPIRINCPAEVIELTLARAADADTSPGRR